MNTPRYWKPLVEVPRDRMDPHRPEVIAMTAKHYEVSEAKALDMLEQYDATSRWFVNDLYQVQASAYGPGCLHLNIRRRDGGMFKDWRHFQQIKNEIAGPECEAVEIYPAESRKVDTTNKWHLWVMPEGHQLDCGWNTRDVSYVENRDVPGLRQRPL